jgi:hypothetical protein
MDNNQNFQTDGEKKAQRYYNFLCYYGLGICILITLIDIWDPGRSHSNPAGYSLIISFSTLRLILDICMIVFIVASIKLQKWGLHGLISIVSVAGYFHLMKWDLFDTFLAQTLVTAAFGLGLILANNKPKTIEDLDPKN